MRSFLTATSLAIAITTKSIMAQTLCNGYSSFCDRPYSNITYVGAHDSFGVDPVSNTANQDYNVTKQLNDGIRLLQGQAHMNGDVVNLCHTSCYIFNGGPMLDYLRNVTDWVANHPNEVITLLFTNADGIPISTLASVFNASGTTKYLYQPPAASAGVIPASAWPTLGELIGNGTRVVVFQDSGADTTSVPFILDEFSNVWENAYDVTTIPFDCAVNRTTGSSLDKMILINHFLDSYSMLAGVNVFIPDKTSLNTTNSVTSIVNNAQVCATEWGSYPTFILVDFYDWGEGSVFAAAAQLNGVAYTNPGNIKPIVNATSSIFNGSPSLSTNSALGLSSLKRWKVVSIGLALFTLCLVDI